LVWLAGGLAGEQDAGGEKFVDAGVVVAFSGDLAGVLAELGVRPARSGRAPVNRHGIRTPGYRERDHGRDRADDGSQGHRQSRMLEKMD
jgi:hypothetical protein